MEKRNSQRFVSGGLLMVEKRRTTFFFMLIPFTFSIIVTIYKYVTYLQRLCRLQYFNLLCTKVYTRCFSKQKYWENTDEQKTRNGKGQKIWMFRHLRGNSETHPWNACSERSSFHPASNYEDWSSTKGNFLSKNAFVL